MANFIESNEIARPYRGSKRRGKQPDKLCIKLFLLDPDIDVTAGTKDLRSKRELERLKNIGCGPPELKFLNKGNKVEFPISMTVEEFKNKLVQIYPKLQDKQYLLLKANEKSKGLERLKLAPSCYNAKDIYYSNVGRGKIYIRCVRELENSQTSTCEPSPSKRPRNMVTSTSSSNVIARPVFRGIRPKSTTQSLTIVPSASNITSSISSTSSTLSVAPNNAVLQPISAAPSPELFSATLPIGITQSMSMSTPTPTSLLSLNSSGLNEARSAGFSPGILSTGTTTPLIPGMLPSMQNNNNTENIINLESRQLQFQQQNQQLQQQQPQQLQQQQQQLQQQQLQQQQQQLQQQLQQLQQQQQELQQQQQQQQQLQQHRQQQFMQQQQRQLQQPVQHFTQQQPTLLPTMANDDSNFFGATNALVSSRQNISSLPCRGTALTAQIIPTTDLVNIGGERDVPVGISIPVQQSVVSLPQSSHQPGPSYQFQRETLRDTSSPLDYFTNTNGLIKTGRNISSPLSALADATVERGPINQEEELMSDSSEKDESTSAIPENSNVSSPDDFDLDVQPVQLDVPVQQSVVSLPQCSHQPGPSYQFQHETLRDTSSLLISFINANSLIETGRNIASPLSALADATVERVPINQEEELMSDSSEKDESTTVIPENWNISSPDDFDLDEFVKECQDTGHVEIFPKILKDRNNLERLQRPSVTISSITIHKQCKLSEVLKVFVLPVSLKVLTIKENCLDADDIKRLMAALIERNSLEELDLSNTVFLSNLRFIFISALIQLTNLKRLSLHNNNLVQQDITLLCAVLPSLAGLEILNLSKNYFSDEDAHAITSALSHLSSLKILELSGNKLCRTKTVINKLKSLKTLEKLDLSCNHGDNFSIDAQNIEQYSLFSNLKVLSLSSNKMTPKDFSNLGLILFLCQSLEELFLDCNHIGISIFALCSLQRAAQRLKTLSLRDTGIGGSATGGLSCLLSKLQQLQVLNLSSNNLASNDFQHLQPFLSNMIHLKVLDVSDNPGGSSMLEHVLPFLMSMEELSARNTNLDEDRVKTISPVISSLKYLKSLDFSKNMIGSVGANALAKVLPLLPYIEKLDLSRTGIPDEAMHTMCVAIKSLKHLKLLNLGGNKIGLNAVTALAETVSLDMLEELDLNECGLDGNATQILFGKCVSLMHLKRLILRKNVLGIIGTSALARVLPSMISLDELDLKYCSLDDKCLEYLGCAILKGCSAGMLQSEGNVLSAKYFVSLKYLKKLDLSGNSISCTGVAALAGVFPSLKSLEELVLHRIVLDNDSGANLFSAMVSLKYLRKLDFSNNKIGRTDTIALAGVLPSLQLLEVLVLRHIYLEYDSDDDSAAKSCAAMVSLKYLRKLDLSTNIINRTGVAALAGVLPSLQLLEELVLGDIYFDDGSNDDSVAKLCSAMLSLKYLRKLNLSTNIINRTGEAALASVFPSLQLLEELRLHGSYLHGDSDDSHATYFSAMISLKYLRKLDLNYCILCSTGAAALAGVLPSLQLLEELVLSNIDFDDGSDDDSYAKLCSAMVSLKCLRKLDLNYCICSTGAVALAGALPSLQLLEELMVGDICEDDDSDHDCMCDNDSVEKLCTAMRSLKYLRKLDLSISIINDRAAALAGMLRSLQLLEELVLRYTDFYDDSYDDSAAKLFAAMVSLKYLRKLDFSNNKIGSTGLAVLTAVLPSLQLLEELVLLKIYIDESDYHSFVRIFPAMVSLKYLKKLGLSCNKISSTGAAALAAMLAAVLPSLQFLKELTLRHCNLNETAKEKLRSKVRPGVKLIMW